eukprot:c11449_g1_i2.p1 GENE.c11449_g1_i2~~c11449_g1_i2.p1  ORF type:complete len:645 (+),score=167.71 c11449_g1_i2:258-2192(+)
MRICFPIGRQPKVDVFLEHESISRTHAVIQHTRSGGTCVYDLSSSNGTMLNKRKVPPLRYISLHVGDVLKFGQSTRLYIVTGPEHLRPPELTKEEVLAKRNKQKNKVDKNGAQSGEPDHEISWGQAEDAIEEDEAIQPLDDVVKNEILSDKQQKALDKLKEKQAKLQHLSAEIERIRAKEVDNDLTEGQHAQIDRNIQRMDKIEEEILELEDQIRESLLSKSEQELRSRKRRGRDDDGSDDEFLDRTGVSSKRQRREKKRKEKLEQQNREKAERDKPVDNEITLRAKLGELLKEKEAWESKRTGLQAEVAKLVTIASQASTTTTPAKADAPVKTESSNDDVKMEDVIVVEPNADADAVQGAKGSTVPEVKHRTAAAAPTAVVEKPRDALETFMAGNKTQIKAGGLVEVSQKLQAIAKEEKRLRYLIKLVTPSVEGMRPITQPTPQATNKTKSKKDKTKTGPIIATPATVTAATTLPPPLPSASAAAGAPTPTTQSAKSDTPTAAASSPKLPNSPNNKPTAPALPVLPRPTIIHLGHVDGKITATLAEPAKPQHDIDVKRGGLQIRKRPAAGAPQPGPGGFSMPSSRRRRVVGPTAEDGDDDLSRMQGEEPSGGDDGSGVYDAEWRPPENQTGDGRTALNDKLGY